MSLSLCTRSVDESETRIMSVEELTLRWKSSRRRRHCGNNFFRHRFKPRGFCWQTVFAYISVWQRTARRQTTAMINDKGFSSFRISDFFTIASGKRNVKRFRYVLQALGNAITLRPRRGWRREKKSWRPFWLCSEFSRLFWQSLSIHCQKQLHGKLMFWARDNWLSSEIQNYACDFCTVEFGTSPQ